MKKIILLFLLTATSIFAQKPPKVDLDRFDFDYKYQQLPKIKVPFEKRTYNSKVNISGAMYNYYPNTALLYSRMGIHGWKNVTENPTVSTVLNIFSFSQRNVEMGNRLVEEKDKDGKITKSYYLYFYTIYFNSSGDYQITASNEFETKTVTETSKESNNRFLQKTTTPVATSEIKTLKYPYNYTYNAKSIDFYSADDAEKDLRLNRGSMYEAQLLKFINDISNNVLSTLNNSYGFMPMTENDKLWIIDSKEEEGQIQKEAIEAVKKIFSDAKVDEPIETTIENLQPLVGYFESLKTKYPNDDKGSRKIRYSAFFNLGQIYIFTDQPEKAIKEGEGLIANDYDKSDGERIIKAANKLIELFKQRNFTNRHNKAFN